MNEYSLTPVQEVDGLHIKRDDLYAPFGPGEVNGGKLRQCVMLVNSVKKDYKSLLTYCSIHSPQAPITAAVARANGMPCRIVYGGTTRESVAALPMPRLAMKYGASIVLAARSGRHSILHARAKELAAQENSFIVQYGINIIGYGDTLLTAVAAQTENLPDDIENLVMTCGSGITATGVMIGLHRYGKRVKRMHLVATAPDRRGADSSMRPSKSTAQTESLSTTTFSTAPDSSMRSPQRLHGGGHSPASSLRGKDDAVV